MKRRADHQARAIRQSSTAGAPGSARDRLFIDPVADLGGSRGIYLLRAAVVHCIIRVTMNSPNPLVPTELHPPQAFRALLDAAVDGIIIIDHQGCIQEFNRAAERLFGYPAREVLGSNVRMLMEDPDNSGHDTYLMRHVTTGEAHVLGRGREVEARRKDGSLLPVFLSVGVMEGSNPPRYVGFVQDISFRRRAEADSYRLQERLTHVSRLATVGEMSAGIAHEINQPLAAVANYAQACDRLLGMPNPDIEEVREALREITVQAVRAGDIIHRLRALARNDFMRREHTDVNLLVGELNELIQLSSKAHDVQFAMELTAALPPVEVDRSQMQQVILNLVCNALEALSATDLRQRKVVLRTQLLPEDQVEIAVHDNGPGISEQFEPRLFEPFSTTKTHGTGLGLASSRSIVKAHEGSLDYRPNTPRGACFSVRLPVAIQD
jgi:two-component system, LuxR family, sensor kinase FixL